MSEGEKRWDRFFIDFATPAVNGNGSMEMDIENLGQRSKEGPRGATWEYSIIRKMLLYERSLAL